MNRKTTEIRRKVNSLLKQSRLEGKRQSCALCGKELTSFCNSHTIPAFILHKIAENGRVMIPSALALNDQLSFDLESGSLVDIEKGINNTWTFHSICRGCDSNYFRDYESDNALQNPLTNKMMAEISLKDALVQLDKRASEIPLYNIMQEKADTIINKEEQDIMLSLDVRDWEFEKRRAQKIIDKNLKSGYKLLFWIKLPYTVPYALQSGVTLDKDILGHQINDVENYSPSVRMQFLQIIVFPLEKCSIVSAFYHKDDRNYNSFAREFDRLTENEKLELINYIAIKHTENICAAPILRTVIEKNERLKKLFSESFETPGFGLTTHIEMMSYSPVKTEEIPNLLSEEYSIEKLEAR